MVPQTQAIVHSQELDDPRSRASDVAESHVATAPEAEVKQEQYRYDFDHEHHIFTRTKIGNPFASPEISETVRCLADDDHPLAHFAGDPDDIWIEITDITCMVYKQAEARKKVEKLGNKVISTHFHEGHKYVIAFRQDWDPLIALIRIGDPKLNQKSSEKFVVSNRADAFMAPEVAITFFENLAADFFAGTVTEEDIKKGKRPSAEKNDGVPLKLPSQRKQKQEANKQKALWECACSE